MPPAATDIPPCTSPPSRSGGSRTSCAGGTRGTRASRSSRTPPRAGLRGRARERNLVRHVRPQLPPGAVVVEMGAGTSRTVAGLLPPGPSGLRYVATDVSPPALRRGALRPRRRRRVRAVRRGHVARARRRRRPRARPRRPAPPLGLAAGDRARVPRGAPRRLPRPPRGRRQAARARPLAHPGRQRRLGEPARGRRARRRAARRARAAWRDRALGRRGVAAALRARALPDPSRRPLRAARVVAGADRAPSTRSTSSSGARSAASSPAWASTRRRWCGGGRRRWSGRRAAS